MTLKSENQRQREIRKLKQVSSASENARNSAFVPAARPGETDEHG